MNLLKGGLVAYSIEELTKAVSNTLGVRVTIKEVNNAVSRNSHRITYVGDHFELIIKF
jgi:hypothetical protein